MFKYFLMFLSFNAFAQNTLELDKAKLSLIDSSFIKLTQSSDSYNNFLGKVIVPNEQLYVLSSPVGGLIKKLDYVVGDKVKKGQVLVKILSPQAIELQSAMLQANSSANLISKNLNRDELLLKEGIISESRYQTTKAASEQANIIFKEKKQALRVNGIKNITIDGLVEVESELDGVIVSQEVKIGQKIDLMSAIYTIANLKELWIDAKIPVLISQELKTGDFVKVNNEDVGKIEKIGENVDAENQNVPIKIKIYNNKNNFKLGQSVNIDFKLNSPTGFLIPNSSIFYLKGDANILIKEKEGKDKVVLRKIKVDIKNQSRDGVIVISKDLKENQEVLFKSVSNIKNMLGE